MPLRRNRSSSAGFPELATVLRQAHAQAVGAADSPLREGFGELEAMFRPFVAEPDLGARTEVAWSSLHGLATLDRGGRLRPELRDRRLTLLVGEWLAAVGAARS